MNLKIAIQKSGRLNQDSLQLLKDCGIAIDNGRDQLKALAKNFPIEVYFLRNGDIPKYLKNGVVDCAIIGENVLVEKGNTIEKRLPLGFSKCRVSLAIPKDEDYTGISYFNNKTIATSYPETLKTFLKSNRIKASVHIINGSVEIAPNIGLSNGICDIVSSGSTLFKNNLKEVAVILKSQAVLAVSPNISSTASKIIDTLTFRMQAVLKGQQSKYVLLNAPNEAIATIIKILPGMRSPTILPLAQEGWSSLHSVVDQDAFWVVIDQLKEAGAEGILVCPIEKMVV